MKTQVSDHLPNGEAASDEALFRAKDLRDLTVTLHYCRIDTGSYGVVAGKRMAASSWQGTAQHVSTTVGDQKKG
jgi:hypothetical protein